MAKGRALKNLWLVASAASLLEVKRRDAGTLMLSGQTIDCPRQSTNFFALIP